MSEEKKYFGSCHSMLLHHVVDVEVGDWKHKESCGGYDVRDITIFLESGDRVEITCFGDEDKDE